MRTIIATGLTLAMLVAAGAALAVEDPVHPGSQVDRIEPATTVAYRCDRFERFADIHIKVNGHFRQMYTGADGKYRRDIYRAAGHEVHVMTTSDRETRLIENRTGKVILYNPGFACPSS
jgi:hypothetical protein